MQQEDSKAKKTVDFNDDPFADILGEYGIKDKDADA